MNFKSKKDGKYKQQKSVNDDSFGLLDGQNAEYENPKKWIKEYQLANGKQLQVKLKPATDPGMVLKGMEEFVFKYAKIMEFGDKTTIDA